MHKDEKEILKHMLPAPINGGFEMEGYWVWCGSVIKGEDGKWHCFASRWKKSLPFHPGWGVASEIVRASSNKPEGPYSFEEIVLPARGAQFWDGRSTHNPSIHKYKDEYILFYMGSTHPFPDPKEDGSLNHHSYQWLAARAAKRIGIAVSKSIFGPWERRDKPILDTRPGHFDNFLVSNPAPCINDDGSCLLIYKAREFRKPPYGEGDMFGHMALGAAYAEHYSLPFVRLSNDPIFPIEDGILEDPFIWKKSDGYSMLVKDWRGERTGHAGSLVYGESKDGINWRIDENIPPLIPQIEWEGGKSCPIGNIDRPFLLFDGDEATHIFIATNDGREAGFATMTKSWNAAIPLAASERKDK